ncbi:hypothetical protein Taro_006325 [Colocasia esculenta]|uniref:SAM-dependent methyltransferase Erg6/SMT-type domain-containing protein n=1 Tax=Colocasia esculenta TaxID=4460 RepID=A0A843U0E0_COLES|nr:hypothetical protein [Colocasia esculenta]
MSKTGALDLATGVGGKIEKKDVQSAVEQYEKYHVCFGGDEETRKNNYSDMVNKYYDLATSFYEFGWGESFHFAHRFKGESLRESIKRHEHFLALQLGLKRGMKVLDVGCGIGGPLREISRFSSTSVTGLNNNEYQISRGEQLNRLAGLDRSCNFVKKQNIKEAEEKDKGMDKGDMKDNNIMQPMSGHLRSQAIVHGLLIYLHFSLPFYHTQILAAHLLDYKEDGDLGLHKNKSIVKQQAHTNHLAYGVQLHHNLEKAQVNNLHQEGFKWVKTLEYVGLAPAGSNRVSSFLEKAAEGLVEGGRRGLFTPMYFFLVQKPKQES